MIVQKLIDEVNGQVQEQKSLQDLIRESLIPQGVEIPKPDLVFGINDIPIFTKKSISTLIGRAKAGKTTVTAWIVSQSIKSNINVLWIDTEQGLYYGSRTQHWVLSMSGLSGSDSLQFYDLKVFNPKQRIEMVELIIKEFKPDLVVIDGIRDLVFDINNPDEATLTTGSLMRWADQYDCHILNLLHQNKGNDHARGHLGTEMINKSETVIKVERDEEKLIICTPEFTRSEPFEVFAFERDNHGMPQLVEGYAGKITTSVGNSKRRTIDPTDLNYAHVHPEVIEKVFSKSEYLKYNDLIENIKYYFQLNDVELGRNKAIEFATHYIMCNAIWKNPYVKGYAKYQKHPDYNGSMFTANTAKSFEVDKNDTPF